MVFEYAGKALAAVDELKGVVKTAGAEPAGELRLGISHSLARVFTRSPLVQFARHFPRVSLSITSDWSRHLVAAVRDNSVDAALLLMPSDWVPSEPLDIRRLGTEEMVVIAPRGVRQARRIDLAALADGRWVVNHEPCVCRAMLRQTLAAAGHPMKVVAELNGPSLHIDLVAAGLGMALVPTRALRTHPARGAVRTLTEPRFSQIMWFAVGRITPVLKPAVDFLQAGLARALESGGGRAHPVAEPPPPSRSIAAPPAPHALPACLT
jgi:DNA-binding transcriptional LysR family regulator